MAPIEPEQYYWEDFQQAERSSWQIIIFYFGVITLLILAISNKLDNIVFVICLLLIGRFLGAFIQIHLTKYRFYALRDIEYLKEHGCKLFDNSELKAYEDKARNKLKKDLGIISFLSDLIDIEGLGFRIIFYFIGILNSIFLISAIILFFFLII